MKRGPSPIGAVAAAAVAAVAGGVAAAATADATNRPVHETTRPPQCRGSRCFQNGSVRCPRRAQKSPAEAPFMSPNHERNVRRDNDDPIREFRSRIEQKDYFFVRFG